MRRWVWVLWAVAAMGQTPEPAMEERFIAIHGVVVNAVTNAPVSRALVLMGGNEYAAMTDDTGHFQINLHEKAPKRPEGTTVVSTRFVAARKNGFLQSGTMARTESGPDSGDSEAAEVTLRLTPEALVVGHVEVPGAEGDVRIKCGLFRREMRNGRARWGSERTFTTWANGEFRFSDLKAGVYKLITHEEMEPESKRGAAGAQEYGYPPVYYPNARDFSQAGEIVLKAGETAEVNLTVEREAYYPVRIAVKNPPEKGGMDVQVWPAGGGFGPGWSLNYDQARGTIEGSLPTGTYTVQAKASGGPGWIGTGDFAVKNKALDGGPLLMAPLAMVQVNVHEDFKRPHMMTDATQGNVRRMFTPTINQLVLLRLLATDEGGGIGEWQAHPLNESRSWFGFANVPPGKYVLEARGIDCYLAGAESGGTDLLHQMLVVGPGGAAPPIEVTLKDDGGEMDVTTEEADAGAEGTARSGGEMVSVHVLPAGSWGEGPLTVTGAMGTVQITQLPPGDYLVLAFAEEPTEDLPYGNLEAMQAWVSQGEMVHVEAGQKVSVNAKVIREEPAGGM